MARAIAGSVVIVTGASSGIGRATALELARRGAHVVLAARRAAVLEQVAVACQQSGVRVLAVPTDVTQEAAVQHLAQQAVEQFGGFDGWINNAGVTVFGRFEQIPSAVFTRVIETNFLGYVYGARAALVHFRSRGAGILINNASMDSQMGAPYLSAYVAAKFAIRGFSECLHEELEVLEQTGIRVCTVMPATIDTPLFQHAANYTGRPVKALPPVYAVEHAARTIVDLLEHPQREVFVGSASRMLTSLHSLAPGAAEHLYAQQVERGHLAQGQTAPMTEGNLFTPLLEGESASGGWKQGHSGEQEPRRATIERSGTEEEGA